MATLGVTPFSQRDPRWADRLLGTSSDTIAKSGCLLCCVAMAANTVGGTDLWPNELNALLNHVKGYMDGNLLAWFSIAAVTNATVYDSGTCYDEPAPMTRLFQHTDDGRPVICRVDSMKGYRDDAHEHWVLLVDEDKCIDPIDGQIKAMKNASRDILSWYVYRRKMKE